MLESVPPPNRVQVFWDIAAHVGNVVGLIAAGIWGYFNFIKSRTYHPRMELSASGKIYVEGSNKFLVPRICLKNIGMSKVELLQEGTGYRVWFADGTPKVGGHLGWLGGKPVFRIFETHGWIEPGESIFHETEVHGLPANSVGAKIEVRLRAPVGAVFPRVSVWTCSAVVLPEGDE